METSSVDGSINYFFNSDGTIQSINRDPAFIGPISTKTSGIAGNAFNDPKSSTGSWFDTALENLNELGTTVYDLGVAGYSKVSANVNRIAASSASTARSIQSGAVSVLDTLNPIPKITNSATAIGEFFQSSLMKILLILLIAAVAVIFIMSYIQAKAGRVANV